MLTVVFHFVLVVAFDISAIVWLMLAVIAQFLFFGVVGIRAIAHKMLAVLVAVVAVVVGKHSTSNSCKGLF